MGEAVGRIYVQEHFDETSKAKMDDLVANLVEAYRQSITALDWMTDETRARASTSSTSSRRRSATR